VSRRVIFPDTTVLINFGLIDAMDLLATLVDGMGAWSASVASECDDQSDRWGLPCMLKAHDIFGEPLRLKTQAEYLDYRANKDFFTSASNNSAATHEGESETLAIITSRCLNSLVVSDDGSVHTRVISYTMGGVVQTCTTWDMLRVAYWKGYITEGSFWAMRRTLLDNDRAHPPVVHDPDEFAKWIRHPVQ